MRLGAAALLVLVAALAHAGAGCDGLDGFARATCELDAGLETPSCAALDEPLRGAAVRAVEAARALASQADGAPARRAPRLLRRAGRKLVALRPRIARAGRRDAITEDCRAALLARVVAVRDAVLSAAGPVPTPLPGLPADVAGYARWLRLNAAPIPERPTGDAHRGVKNVYVNQVRATIAPDGTQRFPYPDGSIVVKAVVTPGDDFIGLFAIMRKRPGSDAAHGDWVFREYARGAADQPFREIARDGVCFGCHGIARPTDWVYTLLE
jgi:hypothetical protein